MAAQKILNNDILIKRYNIFDLWSALQFANFHMPSLIKLA